MSNIICITSTKSLGCTFVDWSVHFLSGQTDYFHLPTSQWQPLSHDPVTDINAHIHLKNQPAGMEQAADYIEKFKTLPTDKIFSLYPTQQHFDVAAEKLNISLDTVHVSSNLEKIKRYLDQDYNRVFRLCNDQDVKLVYVAADPSVEMYHLNIRSLDRFLTQSQQPISIDDVAQEHQLLFFKHSIEQWNKLNLTSRWDQRERMALDSRPLDNVDDIKLDFEYPHLWINCQDLWCRGQDTLLKILDYVGLSVDQTRLQQWHPIYAKWQKRQLEILEFGHNYKHIVDAIVNNWDYKINLTFEQEVVIQHCLIYQHNLNLKTWQLEKFPNNTKDLHKLLEPNIHSIESIY